MARITPLVNNAVHHPGVIVQMLMRNPYTLRDETTESIKETAKALARAGHRAELMDILNRAGLDEQRHAAVLSVLSSHRVH